MMALLGRQALGTYCRTPRSGMTRFDLGRDDPGAFLCRWGKGASHALILGGEVGIDACAEDPVGTARSNVEGTIAFIDAAVARGIVPVYASSDAVYGNGLMPSREGDPVAPTMVYGHQKAAVEEHLARLSSPWLTLRLTKVLDPALAPKGILGPWLGSLACGRLIRCVHDQRFTPVGLGDVGGAIIGLMEAGATGIFNVGGGVALTRLELLNMLIAALSRLCPVEPCIEVCAMADLGLREPRPLDCSVTVTKLSQAIDYAPRTPAELCGEAAATFVARLGSDARPR